MIRSATVALLSSSAVLLATAAARADDVRVDADTAFQAYEVRSPGTAALLARRRLVQTLGVTYTHRLSDEEPERGEPVPRVAASLRVRLDQDFGDDCLVTRDLCYRATEPGDPAFYQPLAEDTEVDAPEAWVELAGLPLGARVRAGRHLHWDTMGLLRIDGATARVEPLGWLAAEAHGGALVRRTSLAGSDAFAPQSDIRLDDEGLEPDRLPFVSEPVTTWAYGGAVELGHRRWARLRAGFRELRERHGLVSRRGALALASQPLDELRLETSGVWDLLDATLVDATAMTAVEATDELTLRAGVERHVPRFDWGTIWAYFDLAPIADAHVGADWQLTDRLSLGGTVRGRRAELGDADETDAGGEVRARADLGALELGVSAFAWGGDLGPVAAVLLDASRPVTHWARVELRASVWHFDDPLREGLYGTSVAEALATELVLSEATSVRGQLEHAYSRVVGHRVRLLLQLSIEVWR